LKDSELAERIADDLFHWLDSVPDWRACGLLPSPIEGLEAAIASFCFTGKRSDECWSEYPMSARRVMVWQLQLKSLFMYLLLYPEK